ncbi:MAG: nucleotidyltransferase family protein, partial [Alloprevotella sp.]
VYLFGDWKKADDAISEELGVTVCNDSEHHTKFTIDDITVENHYDFVNTRIRRSSQKLELVFKELAQDKTNVIDVRGQKVYLPSDKLNAIFLLRHCAGHFASEGITMRNVLDWGLFVQSTKDLDWEWLWQMAKEYNMHRFLACLNMICVEDLGLNGLKFNMQYVDQQLKARVLKEIMNGTDLVPEASAWERTKSWWKHRWKHEICYSDSMLSSFVYSVRANLTGVSIE